MPPRRRRPVLASPQEELLYRVSKQGWSLSSSTKDELDVRDHLAVAFGLGRPTQETEEEVMERFKHLHRNCKNQWLQKKKEQAQEEEEDGAKTATNGDEDNDAAAAPPRETAKDEEFVAGPAPESAATASSTEDRKQTTPTTITIDTTDDEDGEVMVTKPASSSKKGKGEASAMTNSANSWLECSADNCSTNPRCLNWLGQDMWEDDDTALKAFTKTRGLGADPSNVREPGLPVGLKNLGATCYANSFLQVWFRDPIFRKGVYACLPPSNGNVAASPPYQLQVLFAFLQSSSQGVYDPTPLVTALKLDKGEQQDAQEFQKLFMSMLDHEFQKQGKQRTAEGDPRGETIEKLVSSRFGGTIVYGSQCLTCKNTSDRDSTFHELEVTLKPNCKLEDRIAESLKDERMDGDNQYYCDLCQKKRDALRYTRLDSLPPVLHFSLLRFVYSLKEGTRKKSQLAISYPLSIDMGQYLPKGARPGKPKMSVWYDLKGVLMHKGQSAHHGHYVAQVHDEASGKWYLFDDEVVSPIDDLNAPDRCDDETSTDEVVVDSDEETVEPKPSKSKDNGKVKAKTSKAGKHGPNRDADGNIRPRSKDAYMLVYTRRVESLEGAANVAKSEPIPPPLALAEVKSLDAAHGKLVDEHYSKVSMIKSEFERAREAKRSVYRAWHVMEADEESSAYVVHKRELVRWLEEGLKRPVKKPEQSAEVVVEDTRNDKPTSSAPPNLVVAPSTDGAATGGQDVVAAAPESSSLTELSISIDEPAPAAFAPESGTTSTPLDVDATSSSTSTPPQAPAVTRLSNADLLCEHDKIDPNKADLVKRVSKSGMEALLALGMKLEPELMVPRDYCRECIWSVVVEDLYVREYKERRTAFDASDAGHDVVISKAWFQSWMHGPFPKFHIKGPAKDPSPQSEEYLSDVFCEHGHVRRDKKHVEELSFEEASVIQSIHPDWDPVQLDSSEPCTTCERAQEKSSKGNEKLSALAKKEKSILKGFMNDTRLGKNQIILYGQGDHFLIPYGFKKQWLEWVSTTLSAKSRNSERPGAIDNSQLLCKHQRLLVDLVSENARLKTIFPAEGKEWKLLQEHYDAQPQIKIWADARSLQFATSPAACEECIEQQRKDFAETTINIRPIGQDRFDKNGEFKFDRSSSPDNDFAVSSPPASSSKVKTFKQGKMSVTKTYGGREPPPPAAGAVRVSARVRNQGMLYEARQATRIDMKKTDTVKDLKVTISDKMSIPTICQRLFLYGRELNDSSMTVEELGILPDATLELFEVQEADLSSTKLEDVEDDGRSRGTKRRREEGFGGTGLFGWENASHEAQNGAIDEEVEAEVEVGTDGRPQKRKPSNSTEAAEGSAQAIDMDLSDDSFAASGHVPCPHCTFNNVGGLHLCEMCGLPL